MRDIRKRSRTVFFYHRCAVDLDDGETEVESDAEEQEEGDASRALLPTDFTVEDID